MCPRGMEVRPYLIKQVKDLQSEVVVVKGFVKTLKCIVRASWAIIAIMGALLLKAWK
ncbi:hypothetical protein CJ030_MR6G004318 [Morella rubra]|uniref:Uncharacterized protein n=1 Tax=Morella rubra TaxID=262757 RepID=A0A6A1VB53_9ROSI|nr:hypothetical protein CJ030_MR6G004318 [Morella rubra]